jgi:hypothetical protein
MAVVPGEVEGPFLQRSLPIALLGANLMSRLC